MEAVSPRLQQRSSSLQSGKFRHMLACELREWLISHNSPVPPQTIHPVDSLEKELAPLSRSNLLELATAISARLGDRSAEENPLALTASTPSRFPYERFKTVFDVDGSEKLIIPAPPPTLAEAFAKSRRKVQHTELNSPNIPNIDANASTANEKFAAVPVLNSKSNLERDDGLPSILHQYLQAAEIGDADSMVEIGKAFAEGSGGLEKHIDHALTWLLLAADKQNTEAMVTIGKLYFDFSVLNWEARGRERSKSTEEEMRARHLSLAVDWFRLASHYDDLEGMVNLAKCYEYGRGVPKNLEIAFAYYHAAALRGYPAAMNLVGWFYQKGAGVRKSPVEACKWYRKAAESGISDGEENLGIAYCYGTCGDYVNRIEGAHWLWAAAMGAQVKSAFELATLIAKGKDCLREPPKAFEWMLCAAEGGMVRAMERVASWLVEGYGCTQDQRSAVAWYDRAIKGGSVTSLISLGALMETSASYDLAILHYTRAAEKGDIRGKFHLAKCQETGHGIPQNITEAFEKYLSIIQSHTSQNPAPPECFFRIGQCYEYGKGVPQDYTAAVKYYNDSKNFIPSCFALARIYQNGVKDLVEKNSEKAWKLYEYAANCGHPVGAYQIGMSYLNRAESEKRDDWVEAAATNLRKAAAEEYAPAKTKLAALILSDSKRFGSPEEAIQLLHEASNLGNPDAKEMLARMYNRGVEVNGSGVILRSESSKPSLFGGRSEGGIFSLKSRISTSSESLSDSNGSLSSFGSHILLPKDVAVSNRLKAQAVSVRKEKEQVESIIQKCSKGRTAIPDSLVEAIERLGV
ncbi:hypothetical protein HDU84_007376 [Entophlyctis sp. JEL0112]|nr:hypothetical protein HDU84_007376 [Entophlyctis sp. JEL0112]